MKNKKRKTDKTDIIDDNLNKKNSKKDVDGQIKKKDNSFEFINGDAIEQLRKIKSNSISLIITSPQLKNLHFLLKCYKILHILFSLLRVSMLLGKLRPLVPPLEKTRFTFPTYASIFIMYIFLAPLKSLSRTNPHSLHMYVLLPPN